MLPVLLRIWKTKKKTTENHLVLVSRRRILFAVLGRVGVVEANLRISMLLVSQCKTWGRSN